MTAKAIITDERIAAESWDWRVDGEGAAALTSELAIRLPVGVHHLEARETNSSFSFARKTVVVKDGEVLRDIRVEADSRVQRDNKGLVFKVVVENQCPSVQFGTCTSSTSNLVFCTIWYTNVLILSL